VIKKDTEDRASLTRRKSDRRKDSSTGWRRALLFGARSGSTLAKIWREDAKGEKKTRFRRIKSE